MVRQLSGILPAALLLAGLAAGCGTQERVVEEPVLPPPQVEQQPPAQPSIETRTDTIATIHAAPERDTEGPAAETGTDRFKVQVGAFHDPQRATLIQSLARERFGLPTINEFHKASGTYRIRVGMFGSRKEAEDFRRRMQEEFPGEYADAWIIVPGAQN